MTNLRFVAVRLLRLVLRTGRQSDATLRYFVSISCSTKNAAVTSSSALTEQGARTGLCIYEGIEDQLHLGNVTGGPEQPRLLAVDAQVDDDGLHDTVRLRVIK